MAALILAGIYLVKKGKDKRDRRKSLKLDRELRYADLERETEARLAGREGRAQEATATGSSLLSGAIGLEERRRSSSESLRSEDQRLERRRSKAPRRSSVMGSVAAPSGKRRSSMMGTYV